MPDNTCICCGRIIPEGRQICLQCGAYDDLQTFRPRIVTNGDRICGMTAKEYLRQYREAMQRTQAIADHLTELRAVCEQLRTEDGHRIALDAAVANLVDAERKAADEVTRLTALEAEIIGTIRAVPEPYSTLLYERYVNGLTFEQIAVRMHYSWRQIIRLHGQALQYVQDVIACHI